MKEGWITKKVGDCIKLKSGEGLTAIRMNSSGKIPVYGGNGIIGTHDNHNLSGTNIIIGRVGAQCGNARYVTGNIWLTDNAFFISKYFREFDKEFLTYLLNSKYLREFARQAANQ